MRSFGAATFSLGSSRDVSQARVTDWPPRVERRVPSGGMVNQGRSFFGGVLLSRRAGETKPKHAGEEKEGSCLFTRCRNELVLRSLSLLPFFFFVHVALFWFCRLHKIWTTHLATVASAMNDFLSGELLNFSDHRAFLFSVFAFESIRLNVRWLLLF